MPACLPSRPISHLLLTKFPFKTPPPKCYAPLIATVPEIKAAIDKLSFSERAQLEKLLHGQEDDEWDRLMIADVQAGKLDPHIAKVDASIHSRNLHDLPSTRS